MRLTAIIGVCLVVLIGFGLISQGSQWLNEAQSYPEPTGMTYARFIQDRPLSGWFEVKGGMVNLAEAAYLRLNFQNAEELARSRTRNRASALPVTEAYLPLHPQQEYDQKSSAVLLTRDPILLKTINELRAQLRTGSDLEIETWLEKNADHIWIKKDFKGMVRPPHELGDGNFTLLRDYLADGYVLVEEGREPSLTAGIGVIAAGVLLLVSLCLYAYRSYKRGPRRPAQPDPDAGFE